MIRVKGLTKIFSTGNKAIDSLDLDIKEGEILALLGPNGAGKTTTIRVLSTLSGFDEGEVEVAGLNVDTDPEQVRQTIGLVAQQTGIDYFLTGRENLMIQGRMYRMSKADIEKRTEELAHYFELEDALDRDVMTYSGGMRRKLDIATALIHNPKLIFLDEPTLGLDIKSRQNLWTYINKLNKEQNLTILLTTHYLEEADHLSDRVAIINQGKIQIVGTSEELKNNIHGDAVILHFDNDDPKIGDFTNAMHDDPDVKNVVWQNDKMYLYVDNGGEAVAKFVRMTEELGLVIKSLSLAHPTLDDVFLKYTGTTIEDSNGEEEGEEWWHQWAGKDGSGGGGKWKNNWEEWQDKLEESGDDEAKAGWQDNMQKWQQEAETTDTADAKAPVEQAKEAPSNEEQPWPNKDGDQDDWQKWQQQPDASDNAATKQAAPEQQWPDQGGSDDWKKWQQSGDNTDGKPDKDWSK